jgi:hypothetical protein
MLRAVVPAEQGLPSISAVRSLSPGTHGEFNRAFKQKWQRRLQAVVSDMIHSSSTVEAHGATMELPTLKDFSFVLGRLGRVGMWRHCEAISREVEARGMAMDEEIMAKRVWAMARALEIPRSRYSPKPDGKPIADALWGVLAQVEKSDIQTSRLLVNNIISTVGLLQRHFSSGQRRSESLSNDTFKARLDDLMDEVLTKMCGVDLQYFTLAPPSASASVSTTSEVGRRQLSSHALRAVLYRALRTGGVYRMLSAFETLVERSPQQEQADGEARHGGVVLDQEEDMESWPTLSEMEAMEREERQSRGIFGRVKTQGESVSGHPDICGTRVNKLTSGEDVQRDASTLVPSAAAGQIDLTTSPDPTVTETVGDDAGAAEARTFNHFLPPLQSPLVTATPPSPLPASALQGNVHALPASYRMLEKGAIHSLILAACDARKLPLALHILRSAMRITAEVRHAWLGRLLSRTNQDLPDALPTPTSAGSLTPLRDAPPRLGLEAEWFTRVHTLTNKMWPHGRTADKNVLLPRFWSILEDAARQIKAEQAILQSPLAQRAATSNPSFTPTSDVSAPDAITGVDIDININIDSAADGTADHKIPGLANIFDLSSTAASLDSTLASIEQIRSTSIAQRQREVLNKQRRTAAWRIRRGERLQSIAADKAASALGVVDRRAARRRTVKVEGVEGATRPGIMRKSELIDDERTSLECQEGGRPDLRERLIVDGQCPA